MLRRLSLLAAIGGLIAGSLVGSLAGALLPSPCSAQDDRARLHFQAGASYYEAGDYADALREFERSHALSTRSELFYNFSLCYQQLGDLDNAALYLRRFLDEVSAIDNREQLERRHANLLERIEQQRQEQEQERAAAEALAAAEAERASGTAPGLSPAQATESASTDPESGATTSPQPAESGVHPAVIAGFAAAGVGVVLAATFGPLALKERSSIESGCGATRSCTSAQVQQMDGFALAADIGLLMAVAGATVGTIFLVRGRGSRGSSDDAQAGVRLSPYAGPTGAGALLQGAF